MSDQGWDGHVADTGPPAGRPSFGATSPTIQPGWYLDPWDRSRHRFWNGGAWTPETFPNGPATQDLSAPVSTQADPAPLPAAPPTPHTPVVGGPTAPPPEWSAEAPYFGWEGPPPQSPAFGRPDEDVPPPPPKSGRALFVGALIVGLIIGFGVVAGFVLTLDRHSKSSAPTAEPATPQQPGTTSPPPATPAPPTDPSASVLSGLVVQQSDVPGTVTVQPIPGGDHVSGEPTLDLCNGTFASESLRTARLQVAAADAQGATTLSTEAVLYTNPAATAQAFSELKTTAANCPATPVTSPVGEPTATTHFNAAPDGAWPQTPTVDRLAFDFVGTGSSGQPTRSLAVYLRRGRALMGVYFAHPEGTQSAVGGQTTVAGIVNVFAARLAQLPPSVVNGTS